MMMIEPLRFTGLRGELRRNEPLARHTSWRCGGAADVAYVPADRDDLAAFVRQLPADEPLTVVGLGSNLLVRDGGVRGTVRASACGAERARLRRQTRIRAEAGVASPKLSRFAAMHDWAEAEFLSGIPGTVGGALAMNAGCYGGETWGHVAEVEVLTREGALERRSPQDYVIGYRSVVSRRDADDVAFTAAWFDFPPGNGAYARGRIKALLTQRIATQPLNLPNAGSVFRNPEGDHAARLIESCGLKGLCDRRRAGVGKARQLHRQRGRTRERGRYRGVDRARARGRRSAQTGVDLEPEVRIIGEAAMSEFGKVAVLMGGPSSEREISLLSGNAVLAALKGRGIDAHAFDPAERSLFELERDGFERVFIALHGRFGEDGTVQGALEVLRHSVHRQRRDGLGAGDGQVAHQAGLARQRHSDAALPRRRRRRRLVGDRRRAGPAADRQAGARRLDHRHHARSPRSTTTKWRSRIAPPPKHDDLVIVEEFVAGVELTACDPRRARAAADPHRGAAGQLRLPQQVFFRRDQVFLSVRHRRRGRKRDPGAIAGRRFASSAAPAGDALDLILRSDGSWTFLEVNTSPGMTGHSLVPMAARQAGMDFAELCVEILRGAHVG